MVPSVTFSTLSENTCNTNVRGRLSVFRLLSLLAILFFIFCSLYQFMFLVQLQYPTAFTGASPPEGTEEEMKKALENMNGKLQGKKYLAGDTLTLADLSVVFDLSWLEIHPTFDMSPYPNVSKWRQTIRGMPEFKKINEGFEGFIKSKVGGNSK